METTYDDVAGTSISLTTQQPVSGLNSSNMDMLQLPREMTFNDDNLVSVIAYSVLFFIAATGNLAVFITLIRHRKRNSRMNTFILHLCMADMIVTFVMLPMEIGWHVTVAWKLGDAGCRILMLLRAFGFYLSSFVLIVISLDRYFAVKRPLSLAESGKRGKLMLSFAWLLSFLASIPQSVIFHVEYHPVVKWFAQCVTFNFFPSPGHELAYNLFNICAMYLIPLLGITVCYVLILIEISKKARQEKNAHPGKKNACSQKLALRKSSSGQILKARTRTLKMTFVIVAAFFTCWTPYFVISAWWWIDKVSASHIDRKINRGLLIFAVSNSCINPIVYGLNSGSAASALFYLLFPSVFVTHISMEAIKDTLPAGGMFTAVFRRRGQKRWCNALHAVRFFKDRQPNHNLPCGRVPATHAQLQQTMPLTSREPQETQIQLESVSAKKSLTGVPSNSQQITLLGR